MATACRCWFHATSKYRSSRLPASRKSFGSSPFGALEDQVRRNMEMFERAFAMFTPFGRREGQSPGDADKGNSPPSASSDEIHDLKRQMEEMQKRLDRLSDKDKT